MPTKVALLHMHIHLPGSTSLKAKRSRLAPLLARLRREFNVSAAEVDYQDKWSDALVCCALVNTDSGHAQSSLQKVADWVEQAWPDVELRGEQMDLL
ncbi:MAG: DUF503 domain-containing protein [Anaerolineales bacterium]